MRGGELMIIKIDKELGPLYLPPSSASTMPNCKFNVDANSGHAFGILLPAVGALRPCGAPAPVN
jgi:hypothetical protein